jgi:serine/threonine protein kinase
MFNEKLVPKIIDFDIANLQQYGIGTIPYFPPEMLYRDYKFDLKKFDYWGLGIILFMLVKKKVPKFVEKPFDVLKRSEDEYEENFTPGFEEDESILKFAKAMLRPNPSHRDLEAGFNCLYWYVKR